MQDLEATAAENEKTCWCLFRLGITNSKEGSKPFTRESFGRFSTDLKQTDSASLGWNDFMSMDTFTDAAQGYLKVRDCGRVQNLVLRLSLVEQRPGIRQQIAVAEAALEGGW